MLKSLDIASLIPHQRAMCLLEDVVSWDETRIVCRTSGHRHPSNPLRVATGLLAASGIEYAAQAVAVHGGLVASSKPGFQAPSNGYLANAKDVTWSVERLDDIQADLIVEAEQLISEGGRSIYSFNLLAEGRSLMQGRVAVVLEGVAE